MRLVMLHKKGNKVLTERIKLHHFQITSEMDLFGYDEEGKTILHRTSEQWSNLTLYRDGTQSVGEVENKSKPKKFQLGTINQSKIPNIGRIDDRSDLQTNLRRTL